MADDFLRMLDDAMCDESNPEREYVHDLMKSLWTGTLWRGPEGAVLSESTDYLVFEGIWKLERLLRLVKAMRTAYLEAEQLEELEPMSGDFTSEQVAACHNHFLHGETWLHAEGKAKLDEWRAQQQKGKDKGNHKGKGSKKGKRGKHAGDANPGRGTASLSQLIQQNRKSWFNVFLKNESGSKQLLMALVRQPSMLTPAGLTKLIEEWKDIKTTPEYKDALEFSRRRTTEERDRKRKLQELRTRLRIADSQGEDTSALVKEHATLLLLDKREKPARPPGAYLATNAEPFSTE